MRHPAHWGFGGSSRRLSGVVLLAALTALTAPLTAQTLSPHPLPFPPVLPGQNLRFPQDQGSHPAFRTEWWYVTGRIRAPGAPPIGFQITFFRSRPPVAWNNPSRFNPRQLLFAHVALSDPRVKHLLHDQRAARAGFGLAEARQGGTDVWIGDWRLAQNATGYQARLNTKGFALDLRFRRRQPPLLQGQAGYSRKGPEARDASYYYSEPQLDVLGHLRRGGQDVAVTGTAWLDHEWSSHYLNPQASGWDWTGLNLQDGSALMLFRMRDRRGGTLWVGGSYRDTQGRTRVYAPGEIRFVPLQYWTSPRTRIRYPVQWALRLPGLDLRLVPTMLDQELDSRGSTGAIYWEGAVDVLQNGRALGSGYLELTGYGARLRM